MANTKHKVGDRWMKDGIRYRQGKKGRTYQVKVSSREGTVWEAYKTLEEAKRARDKERTAAHEGTQVFKNGITVGRYIETYVEQVQVRESSRALYRRQAEHIKEKIGGVKLQDLTPAIVRDLVYNLQTRPRWADEEKQWKQPPRPASAKLKLSVLALLNAACKQAVQDSVIKRNPCDGVKRPEGVNRGRERRPLTQREAFTKGHVLSPTDVSELLAHVEGHFTWLPAFTLWRTGLRRGELAALQWRDVDLENSRIHIRGSVSDSRELGLTKTDRSAAAIAIDPELADLLRERRAAQFADAKALTGQDGAGDWFVFAEPAAPTVPMRPGNLYSNIALRLKRTRFAKVTPHDFRHAHGSYLLDCGWSIARVAARLRDTQETLLKTYSHQLKDAGEADAINTVFGTEKPAAAPRVAKSGKPRLAAVG